MITFVNIIYQSQKLRRSKQRIESSGALGKLRKIFRSSEKISRLCAGSVVVVCATEEKEAQTWQRNGQTARAIFESARMGDGKGDIPLDTMKKR